MTTRAKPGQSRSRINMMELGRMFPNEDAATKWFESILWPDVRACGKCGSINTKETPNGKPMPYWCRDCRGYFSVRTGTALRRSHVPLDKWAVAIYIYVTRIKSISSAELAQHIDVTGKTAWFMLHRLREGWDHTGVGKFLGPVEVDETYVGGLRKNMSNAKRWELRNTGRGSVGKTAVVGMKDRNTKQVRAKVVENVDYETLDAFISEFTDADVTVYSDGARVYGKLPHKQKSVNHSVGEYVRGKIHTNGIESFWSTLKRAHKGTFHVLSKKHLHRYVKEFEGRHNARGLDALTMMQNLVTGLIGKHLMYQDLTETVVVKTGLRFVQPKRRVRPATLKW
ncbi:MAG: IS1595 family transposase [Gammaproteobacteria bacterium]|nr:IS1595 family transposase [Gammaproteobacteria bacterium]